MDKLHSIKRDYEVVIKFSITTMCDNPDIQIPYVLELIQKDVTKFVEEELEVDAEIEIKASEPETLSIIERDQYFKRKV